MSEAIAVARSNIALTKYWGKSDVALNLPAVPSLSLTLAGLETRTRVCFDATRATDGIRIDDHDAEPEEAARVTAFLDLVRRRAGSESRAVVESSSTFPAGAGLASSASAFAALAAAATRAAGLDMDLPGLSALARRGSASAARSVFGGFVELPAGTEEPLPARPVPGAEDWAVRMVVVRCGSGRKAVSSREAMSRTAATSPYYAAWVASATEEHARALGALARRDIRALGESMERSCLRMHAAAMAAEPPVAYWNGETLDGMATVRSLRASGVAAYFTVDAGPHVKVLCMAEDAPQVAAAFGGRASIHEPGTGVEVT